MTRAQMETLEMILSYFSCNKQSMMIISYCLNWEDQLGREVENDVQFHLRRPDWEEMTVSRGFIKL